MWEKIIGWNKSNCSYEKYFSHFKFGGNIEIKTKSIKTCDNAIQVRNIYRCNSVK